MVVPSTVKELKTLLQNFDAKDPVALEQIAGLAARYPTFNWQQRFTLRHFMRKKNYRPKGR